MAAQDEDMPRIRAPTNLPQLVKAAFEKAKSSGDLTHYPTQVAVLSANGIPFQLRFSPALANKPRSRSPAADKSRDKHSKSPPDPFDNPHPSLLVARLQPPQTTAPRDAPRSQPDNKHGEKGEQGHILVLNKFAVVPEHFILATAAWAPQTHLLQPADLEATYACLEAYGDGTPEEASHGASAAVQRKQSSEDGRGGEPGLFAFFNSGPHSGASQPHRHVQLVPVARMRDGLPPPSSAESEGGGWEILARRLVGNRGESEVARRLPFTVFGEQLQGRPDGEALHRIYLRLYRRACEAVGNDASDVRREGLEAGADDVEGEEARISYNMAMTLDAMVLCPRTAEGTAVTDANGKDVGTLSLNGTVLSGAALVKNEAEWDALREDPAQLARLLGDIGVRNDDSAG